MDEKTITGLTEEQNKLASFILDKVYKANRELTPTNNSLWDFRNKMDANTTLNTEDLAIVINLLEIETWIEPQKYEGNNLQHKISNWAWTEFNGGASFIDHYEKEQEHQKERENLAELDNEIKEKTLEHLNRSIFKQKHAIWFFLANIVVTISVALFTAYLVFKFGWK